MDLKGKTVTVVGLGNSGINAAVLAGDAGAAVRATDGQDTPATREAKKRLEDRGIKVETGRHTKEFVEGSDLVVISPGVEDSAEPIKWAVEAGIPVISEMEFGFRFCKGKIIAITGTNGKTTVTSLIGDILKDGGLDTVVCGNIGNSLSGEISRIKEDTWVVLEVSSFQLERIENFKPAVALILNITDDHMDRYTRFSDYFNYKLNIFRNQDENDILILNYDAENLRDLAARTGSKVLFYSRLKKVNGAYLDDDAIMCGDGGAAKKICSATDTRLKGLHNVENILACCLAATVAGVGGDSICGTIRRFKGLSHRFETVAVIDGVEYIDDSKGTTVDSTYRALESCTRPVVLIAGGKDKHSDYTVIREIVAKKARHVILIGEAKDAIRGALEGTADISEAGGLPEAVGMASRLARPDHIVLLSPMCSSFDMFTSYKERGEVFKKAVMELKKGSGIKV